MKKFILGLVTGLLITIIPVAVAFALPVAPTSFSDVYESDWYYQSVSYLSSQNVISGYSDGTFRPDNLINRAETAKMIYKTYTDLDVREEINSLENQVEALQVKIDTLSFEGTCYYNDQWYDEGESDPASACTCQSDGTMSCPSAI